MKLRKIKMKKVEKEKEKQVHHQQLLLHGQNLLKPFPPQANFLLSSPLALPQKATQVREK
jgi:hypothetical protein